MALDWGRVRIGVALSDPLRIAVRALTTLTHRDEATDMENIRRLIEQHGVAKIVVGYPLHMSGERGRAAAAVERFSERLRATIGVPVQMWDERLTTREAEQALREMSVSRRRRAQSVDRMAAALILRNFLEFERQRDADGAGNGMEGDG